MRNSDVVIPFIVHNLGVIRILFDSIENANIYRNNKLEYSLLIKYFWKKYAAFLLHSPRGIGNAEHFYSEPGKVNNGPKIDSIPPLV